MKLILVLVTLAVCSYSACANGGGSGDFGFGEGFGCACTTRSNPCRRNNGTNVIGCPRTNKFVQCTDITCSPQTCPTGQVWNATLKSCAACQPGYHVAANNQTCVCDQGTKPTGPNTCGPCPSGAAVNPDSCYCSPPLTLNRGANACQACPANSVLRRDECICNKTLFWNEAAWACQPCPGTWVTVTADRRTQQQCQCTAPQVFDRSTVSCKTCPSGTTADSDGDSCDCPIPGQYYNTTTSACQCPRTTTLNTAGTACQWVPAGSGRR